MSKEYLVRTIKEILQNAGVKKAYLFGSFARNEKKYHDIDIAIKPPRAFSLLDLAHLENVLESKTKKKMGREPHRIPEVVIELWVMGLIKIVVVKALKQGL